MPPPLKAASTLGVSYRNFTDDDLPFVSELYASTRRDEVAMTGWPPEHQASFLAQQAAAQHNHYALHYADGEWLIIERDEKAIGRLYLRETPGSLRIVDISLMPASRGQGIGSAILADIIDHARNSASEVTIHVERNNPARSLYRRLGFETIEEKGIYDLLALQP